MSLKVHLEIDDRQQSFYLTPTHVSLIRKAVFLCCQEEDLKGVYEVSLSLVSNEEIRKLNHQFRGKEQATDVLSFPLGGPVAGKEIPLGDIVLSTERMEAQAVEYGHEVEREFVYLVVHSMFHLLGYDHGTRLTRKEMRKKEESVMDQLKLVRGKGNRRDGE